MAASIRPMPGQLWRPTRQGSQAIPRLIIDTTGQPITVRFQYRGFGHPSPQTYAITLTGWFAWVRMHAAVGELHTGDP